MKNIDEVLAELAEVQGLAGGYASENLRLQSKCDEQAAEIERLNRTTCACRFDNGENTEQCKLHGAWCDTLHEQADYRRERDQLRAKVAAMESALQAPCSDWKHRDMCKAVLAPGAAPHTEQANKALREAADRSYAIAKLAQAAPAAPKGSEG